MRKTILLGLSGLALTLGAAAQCTPPSLQVPASFSICNGRTTATLAFGSNDANATFSWTNSNPAIGLAASGSDDIAPFTAVNTGGADATATVLVVASANGCSSAAQSFTITVKPSPATPSISQQGNLLQSSGATTYVWYYNGSPVDGANGASFAALQSGSYAVQTLGSNGCPSAVSPALNLVITGLPSLPSGSGLRLAGNRVRGQAQLLQTGPARSYTVYLLSAGGALLQALRIQGSTTLELGRYPAGLYLLLVRDERSGQLWQERLVRE